MGRHPEAFPSRSHSATPALRTYRGNEDEKRECVPRSVGVRSSFSDRQPFFRPLVLLMPLSLFAPLQSHFEAFVTVLRLFFFCRLYIINVLSPRPWLTPSERARKKFLWNRARGKLSSDKNNVKKVKSLDACSVQLRYRDFLCLGVYSVEDDSTFPDLDLRSLLMTIQSVWLRKQEWSTHTLPYNASW